ncbi:MAG TPA: class I SAM-dependent methyltransferase [Dongiaceae bacterium]|jgi:SAM-dependent methyltransferase
MSDFWQEQNRRRWDELAAVHPGTAFYGVDRFKAGEDALLPIERAEVGPVAGKSLLHLQCHIGLDTLNWARKGARVTGLDYSGEAVRQARKLAAETGLAADFVEADVYDAREAIGGSFDIVYVTWGALLWLPDLRRWAKIVASLLSPGGFLYLLEGHPAALMLDQKEKGDPLTVTLPYSKSDGPLVFTSDKTYAGGDVPIKNETSYEWAHSLSDIVMSVLNAGLALEFLHEHDCLAWQLFPAMERRADGMWVLPKDRPAIPLAYSLKARRHG